MISDAKARARVAAVVAGLGALLLLVAFLALTVFRTPGGGADIGAGIVLNLGILLFLIGAGLGIGAYVPHRRSKKQTR